MTFCLADANSGNYNEQVFNLSCPQKITSIFFIFFFFYVRASVTSEAIVLCTCTMRMVQYVLANHVASVIILSSIHPMFFSPLSTISDIHSSYLFVFLSVLYHSIHPYILLTFYLFIALLFFSIVLSFSF